MKICFISPPTVVEFNERSVDETEAARLIFEHAPSGILSLAAVVDQQQLEVEIVDLNRLFYEYVIAGLRQHGVEFCGYAARRLESISADVFGFSTICGSYPLTLRLAQAVAETHPEASIILGGPQASVVDVASLEAFPFVNVILRGEAEETLPRVLEALAGNASNLKLIGGITFRDAQGIVRNPNAPVIEDMDGLPLPAFHLYPQIEGASYAPLEAGRGCPFACSFCSTNDFFRRRFRMKSADVLVEQMKTVKQRYGIDSFDLIHDMFTVDRKKVVAFCEAIARSGEDLYWGCTARTDCIDDELIDLMAANGCIGIFFGIDSGSDRLQGVMQKHLNLVEAADRIRRANRRRIKHTVSLITGFPEENREDLRGTVNFIGEASRHEFAKIQLHLLAPLAETPITTQYQDQLIFDDIFSDMSLQGWDQDPEERAMIVRYPKIFPNFYGVPTHHLDRSYLRELREFLLHAVLKVRWLIALLHRDKGDLLEVFDEWLSWSGKSRFVEGRVDTSRSYYMSDDFPKDLRRFVESSYLQSARYPHLVKTLAEIETAQFDFANGNGQKPRDIVFDSLECVPTISTEARVFLVNADYRKLLRSLKRRERFDTIPVIEMPLALVKTNGKVRVVELSALSYELMNLCDGSRSIGKIAADFSGAKQLRGSALTASVYGLVELAKQGLIEVQPARN